MKVAPVSSDLLIKLTLVAAAVGVLFYAAKKVSSAAQDMAGNAVDAVGQMAGDAVTAVDNTVANVVVGAGGIVGIPATDNDQCTLDLARGDMWAASFSCPASRFIKGVVNPPANVGVTGSW